MMTDQEFGRLTAQVEYLRDAIKTAQMDISTALNSKRDVEYGLKEIQSAFEHIASHAEEIEIRVKNLQTDLANHINSSIKPEDFLAGKVGKWVLGIVIAASTFVAIDFFKPIIIKVFGGE